MGKEEEAEIRKFGGKGDDQCDELDPHRQNEVDNLRSWNGYAQTRQLVLTICLLGYSRKS